MHRPDISRTARRAAPQGCGPRAVLAAAALALACLPAPTAHGGRVVLRIRAGNPVDRPQTVKIRSNLPPRATTNDIISLGGLNLGYDVKSGLYYVHKDVELGPKEIVVYDVEIDDIWALPASDLDRLAQRADMLAQKLQSTRFKDSARLLRNGIVAGLDAVRINQQQFALQPGVKPAQHIQAYEADLNALRLVKGDLARLENLALVSGLDPGTLVTSPETVPSVKRDTRPPPEGYKTALFRIAVRNTSTALPRAVNVRRDLPSEIRAEDVLDPAGLEVGTDPKTGRGYVLIEDLRLDPAETAVFDLKIRDKWDVNGPRMDGIAEKATQILTQVRDAEQYASVQTALREVLDGIDRIRAEIKPSTLGPQYVEFFRDQATRLDRLQQQVERIESALRPLEAEPKLGFRVKAPSAKTTWLIIYGILGFLAVFSIVFFFRWYARSRAERLEP